MTPERWQQVKNTLAEALEHPDEEERAAFVANASADDPELRREVESLLAQSDDEFESVAGAIGIASPGTTSSPDAGRRIGQYELIREIGRGGMGAVWLARRADQQFEKLVAIKLLKRGTDTDEVLRRFQTERQILARLEHPNIARLLDGGVTDDDLPYFVMEYVEGRPVTEFCRAQSLTIEERLRLFAKICSAVQFAHQNLVVHRDLKPGNILVTADGEPKLLDFGIAKLLTADDAALSVTIAEHQRLTPAYASPEQVRSEPITTVSDVYSLGTLLYEILTGKNAHRFSVPQPPPTELLRVVAQEEPVRPSAAAADSSNERRLRGDLDNIVLKALRKEPARRYAGVGSFALDIRRYLERKPVTARKDTLSYRGAKFVQRNKLGVAAAVVVLLTLIGGIAGIIWEARLASRRFNDVRRLAHSVVFDYHDAIANLPGSTAVREKLVKDSLQYLDNLAKDAGGDRSLQAEIAAAYLKIGDIQGAPYRANLGDTQGAFASYERARQTLETLAASDPRDRDTQRKLSIAYNKIGQILLREGATEKGLEAELKSVAIAENLVANDPAYVENHELLADSYINLGKASYVGGHSRSLDAQLRALEKFNQALAIHERLAAEHPEQVRFREQVAIDCTYASYALSAIARLSGDRTRYEAALQALERSSEIEQKVAENDPLNVRAQRNAASVLGDIAMAELELQNAPAAQAASQRALSTMEKLAAADASNLEAQRDLADINVVAGRARMAANDTAAAKEHCRRAIAIYDRLLKTDAVSAELRDLFASTYDLFGDVLAKENNSAGAIEALQHALTLLEQSPANAWSADPRDSSAAAHAKIAGLYEALAAKAESPEDRRRNWLAARAEFRQSLEIYTELKAKGVLVGSEPARIEQISAEIAKCDAALNAKASTQIP